MSHIIIGAWIESISFSRFIVCSRPFHSNPMKRLFVLNNNKCVLFKKINQTLEAGEIEKYIFNATEEAIEWENS